MNEPMRDRPHVLKPAACTQKRLSSGSRAGVREGVRIEPIEHSRRSSPGAVVIDGEPQCPRLTVELDDLSTLGPLDAKPRPMPAPLIPEVVKRRPQSDQNVV